MNHRGPDRTTGAPPPTDTPKTNRVAATRMNHRGSGYCATSFVVKLAQAASMRITT